MDGGCRGDAARVEAFITEVLHRPIRDLRLMVVSHMHPDHAGAAPVLRQKFGIPIASHYNIDKWYRGWRGWLQHRVDRSLAQYSARRNGKKRERVAYSRKIHPEFPLKDGDTLPYFPDWQALVLPGHTSFDICLFNSSKSILYAADMVLFRNEKFMLPFPIPFPEKMRASLSRLAKLETDTLLLAHGGKLLGVELSVLMKTMGEQVGKIDNPIFQRLTPFCTIGPEIRKDRRKHRT